jgi:hypothetical protein
MSKSHDAPRWSVEFRTTQALPEVIPLDGCESDVRMPDVSATRVAFRLGGSLRFSELFLIPIIGRTQGLPFCDPVRWTWIGQPLADALDHWLDTRQRRSVFARLYPYDWISSWTAEGLRAHVLSTVPGWRTRTLTFQSESLDLPAEAPRLAFIFMVLTAKRGWPELPAQGEARFRKVVALALQGHEEPEPIVLSPGAPAEAVPDGLFCWLQELSHSVGIAGWSVHFTPASADVVKVTLALGRQSSHVQFAVRLHQVGSNGLQHLLRLLTDTAPMLERPSVFC